MAWLHVPSTALPSAPVSEDSNSASTLPWESYTELFVTLSGKPTQRPSSWRGWRTRLWTRLLSGTISRPSMANRGTDSWIVWQRAIRASRSRSPVLDSGRRILDTSGPRSSESSQSVNQPTSSVKTWTAICPQVSTSSPRDFKAWVTSLQQDCLRRLKLARHIDADDSSSWPSPTARDWKDEGANVDYAKVASKSKLGGVAVMTSTGKNWPSPRARDYEKDSPNAKAIKGKLNHLVNRYFPPPPDDLNRWSHLLSILPEVEPSVCRDADGTSNRVDRLRAIGNGVVPVVAGYAFLTLAGSLEAEFGE